MPGAIGSPATIELAGAGRCLRDEARLVYEALVPSDAMLARLTGSIGEFRPESEEVIDTRGIKVTEHRRSCPRPPALADYLRTNRLSSEHNTSSGQE